MFFTCPNFTKLFLCVTCGCGWVFLWRCWNMLRTSGFVDDVTHFLIIDPIPSFGYFCSDVAAASWADGKTPHSICSLSSHLIKIGAYKIHTKLLMLIGTAAYCGKQGLWNGTVTIRLSHSLAAAACCRFAAVGLAGTSIDYCSSGGRMRAVPRWLPTTWMQTCLDLLV